jgi:hypothetical protein
MAVYQISRIQIRRGQANSGTGLPQLASGEMAWAIDTQELYIGSGAVSEGAPAVGNVKVITSIDLADGGNILSTLGYTYQVNNTAIQTGTSATSPVARTLASRLDDQVSTKSFGTVADGATDDTAALQRAINQLFLNSANRASNATALASGTRVILTIPAGTYYTSSTIYIPSYAALVGAGADHTIINYNPQTFSITGSTSIGSPTLIYSGANSSMIGYNVTGVTGIQNGTFVSSVTPGVSLTLSQHALTVGTSFTLTAPGPAFQFVNDSATIASIGTGTVEPTTTNETNQPRKILMQGLTVNTTTGLNTLLQMNSVKDSIFENMYLRGGWTSNTTSIGITMTAINNTVTCEHNIFRNITANGFTYGVYSAQLNSIGSDILFNSFTDCHIFNALIGMYIGVGYAYTNNFQYGPRQTNITRTKFYNIKQQAVYFGAGTGNILRDCVYTNVGNNGGGNQLSQYSQVYFATYGNSSVNDQSDRHSDLANPSTSSNTLFALIPYVPEVSGHSVYTMLGNRTITLTQTTSTYVAILKLPFPWLPSPSDRTTGPTGSISYNINYTYVSSTAGYSRYGVIHITADTVNKQISVSDEYDFTSTTQTYVEQLDFQATFVDNAGLTTLTNPWNILISYQNTTPSDTGTFTYNYTSTF